MFIIKDSLRKKMVDAPPNEAAEDAPVVNGQLCALDQELRQFFPRMFWIEPKFDLRYRREANRGRIDVAAAVMKGAGIVREYLHDTMRVLEKPNAPSKPKWEIDSDLMQLSQPVEVYVCIAKLCARHHRAITHRFCTKNTSVTTDTSDEDIEAAVVAAMIDHMASYDLHEVISNCTADDDRTAQSFFDDFVKMNHYWLELDKYQLNRLAVLKRRVEEEFGKDHVPLVTFLQIALPTGSNEEALDTLESIIHGQSIGRNRRMKLDNPKTPAAEYELRRGPNFFTHLANVISYVLKIASFVHDHSPQFRENMVANPPSRCLYGFLPVDQLRTEVECWEQSEHNLFRALQDHLQDDEYSWLRPQNMKTTPFSTRRLAALLTQNTPPKLIGTVLVRLHEHYRSICIGDLMSISNFTNVDMPSTIHPLGFTRMTREEMERKLSIAITMLHLPIQDSLSFEEKIKNVRQRLNDESIRLELFGMHTSAKDDEGDDSMDGEIDEGMDEDEDEDVDEYEYKDEDVDVDEDVDEYEYKDEYEDRDGNDRDNRDKKYFPDHLALRIVDGEKITQDQIYEEEFIGIIRRILLCKTESENNPILAESIQMLLWDTTDPALNIPLQRCNGLSIREVVMHLALELFTKQMIAQGPPNGYGEKKPLFPMMDTDTLTKEESQRLAHDFTAAELGNERTWLTKTARFHHQRTPGSFQNFIEPTFTAGIREYFQAGSKDHVFPFLNASGALDKFFYHCRENHKTANVVRGDQEYNHIDNNIGKRKNGVRIVSMKDQGVLKTHEQFAQDIIEQVDDDTTFIVLSSRTRFGDTPCSLQATDAGNHAGLAAVIRRIQESKPDTIIVLDVCQSVGRCVPESLQQFKNVVILGNTSKALGAGQGGFLIVPQDVQELLIKKEFSPFSHEESTIVRPECLAATGWVMKMSQGQLDHTYLNNNFGDQAKKTDIQRRAEHLQTLTEHTLQHINQGHFTVCEPTHRNKPDYTGIVTFCCKPPEKNDEFFVRLSTAGYKISQITDASTNRNALRISFEYRHSTAHIDGLLKKMEDTYSHLVCAA